MPHDVCIEQDKPHVKSAQKSSYMTIQKQGGRGGGGGGSNSMQEDKLNVFLCFSVDIL